jgi:uncharacterized protein
MKRMIISVFMGVLILSTMFTGCIQEQKEKTKSNIDIAIEYITFLSESKYQQAYAFFTVDMKNSISLESLQELWESYIEAYGEFESIGNTSQTNSSEFNIIFVNVTFQDQYLIVFRIVFNDEQQIAGFWTDEVKSLIGYRPPDYVNTSTFSEINITIGSDPWKLPATLSIPKGSGPFPCVILIQGSGPNDRDETIGPNKPFKDIAWGLASQNITVLRYDKRTFVYPEEMSQLTNITVYDEIIDDVFSAIRTMKTQSYVPINAIYLLGHSLGAMMIPRIVSINDSDINGAILLAAPARPLEDLILNQTQYLLGLDGSINASDQAIINETKVLVQKIKTLNFTDNESIFSTPPSYWKDLASYNQVETAKQLDIPLFFLQGKRDYQVTYEDDYQIWYNALHQDPQVTFKTYDTLNHLFISGQGTPTNTEYLVEGHVDAKVINDIVQWIESQTHAII